MNKKLEQTPDLRDRYWCINCGHYGKIHKWERRYCRECGSENLSETDRESAVESMLTDTQAESRDRLLRAEKAEAKVKELEAEIKKREQLIRSLQEANTKLLRQLDDIREVLDR